MVTAADISELRARTGVGLADCKKALIEAEGNIEKAAEILRQKGLASAAKKAGKIAAEGAVKAAIKGNRGVLIELNSQTDFVAKNEEFQKLLSTIVETALESGAADLGALKATKTSNGETVDEYIVSKTAQIGEKLDLRRYAIANAPTGGMVFEYTHPIGSKIAVLGVLQNGNEQLGKDIAMHIAATQPQPEFLGREEIPADVYEKEKEIELGKEDLANKPADIREKIVVGRVEKALLSKVLLEQDFIKDPSKKVKELVASQNAEILSFTRFNLGEGVEKQEVSFAEEVAAQTRGA